jgi:hypothetical protein
VPSARVRATMSSAVEAISCPKVDVPAGPEPGEPAKEAAPPAEHCDTAPNGKCAPRCHGEEEADEDEDEEEEEKAPKAIDLGPMVSIKEQLEKDKVRMVPCLNSSACSVRFFSSLYFFGAAFYLAGRREPAAMEGAAPRRRGLELRGR